MLAERGSERIADGFWLRRGDFEVELTPVNPAIRPSLASRRHPFIHADSADAPNLGALGDSTIILRELLQVKPA
jgi:microcystin degradation protein MlrC